MEFNYYLYGQKEKKSYSSGFEPMSQPIVASKADMLTTTPRINQKHKVLSGGGCSSVKIIIERKCRNHSKLIEQAVGGVL